MKKLLAVLLALLAIGGFAFAAPAVGLSLDGTVTLVDQNFQGSQSWDDSYINFSAADPNGMYGIYFALGNDKANASTTADDYLYINGWKAYGYFFNKMLKVQTGNQRSTGYYTASAYLGSSNGTYTLGNAAGDCVLFEVAPMTGLTIAAQLPYTTTAQDMADIFAGSAVGVAYTIDKVGVAKVYANLTNWKPYFGYGFSFTGVENLSAVLYGKVDLTGTDAAVTADLSATYTVAEFTPEFEFKSTIAPDFAGTAYVGVNWAKDALSADIDTSFSVAPDFAWGGITADAYYAFDNNFKLGVNVGYSEADGFTFSVPLTYDFAF